jgi:hypothetical protein
MSMRADQGWRTRAGHLAAIRRSLQARSLLRECGLPDFRAASGACLARCRLREAMPTIGPCVYLTTNSR